MWRTEGGVASVLRRPNLLGELEDWEEREKEEDDDDDEEDGEDEREEKANAAGIAATAVAVVATDLRNAILLPTIPSYLLHRTKCTLAGR